MNFEKLQTALQNRGFKVSVFSNRQQAAEYLNKEIDNVEVGIGGSVTVKELGLYDMLKTHNKVYWHWSKDTQLSADEIRTKAMSCDVYLSSVNGISENGEIINIDGNGNRIAGIEYGHDRVYLIVGKNKVAEDLHAAYNRAQNIAAPKNAMRLNAKTPCAIKGDHCYNCNSEAKICRFYSIITKAPKQRNYEVVLIDEELGY